MIIYGKNTVREIFKNNKKKIFKIYLLNNKKNDKIPLYIDNKYSNIIFFKDKNFLNQIAGNKNHQGIILDIEDYSYRHDLSSFLKNNFILQKKMKFLMLDNIQDPHNLGAILRTCDGAGIQGVIIAKKHQVTLNATVAKVASGALEYVSLFLVNNLYLTIKEIKSFFFVVVGADEKGNLSVKETSFPNKNLLIIVGNEGKGLRFLIKKQVDFLVKIPMIGKISSLNVSVATALMLYFL